VSESKYKMIKNWIKSKILDGTLVPNQKIHSESELMEIFDVSRHTVRLAIGELVSEGYLFKRQGSGTFVTQKVKENNTGLSVNQKRIAIITTYISDYIFPSIIRGAENVLRNKGYQISLFSTNNDYENEKNILETIIAQKFDGIIIEPTKSANFNPNINYYLNIESLGIPYIMINAYYEELGPTSVLLDDEKGGFLQTEHLIKLGHRNILGFFKTDDMQGTKRLKGYLKAHRFYGVPINQNNIITYSTEEKLTKPAEILENILDQSVDSLTAIVCYNDELAMSLIEVLRNKNIAIPDDISIVGFDDSFLAEISEVKLTTIKHPKIKLGEKAAEKIIDLIDFRYGIERSDLDKKEVFENYVFEPELVIRNSTRKIK